MMQNKEQGKHLDRGKLRARCGERWGWCWRWEWGPLRTQWGAGSALGHNFSCGHCSIVPGGSLASPLILCYYLLFFFKLSTEVALDILPSSLWSSGGWGWGWCQLTHENTLPLNTPSNPAIISSCSGLDEQSLLLRSKTSLKFPCKGNSHLSRLLFIYFFSHLLILTSQWSSSSPTKSLLLGGKVLFKDLLLQM